MSCQTDIHEKLHEEGFDPQKDADLFTYVDHWLLNNQNIEGDTEFIYSLIQNSYGYNLYLETGEVPEEDD